jgi:hypothetical protein
VSLDCACGFGPRHELGAFSREWHSQHRDHHLAVFPDVDRGTIDNLTAAIYSAPTMRKAEMSEAQRAVARRGIVVQSHRTFRIPETARLAAQRTIRAALESCTSDAEFDER